MKKIVVISDVHGRNMWKDIIKKESPAKFIFIGDYWDSFNIPFIVQVHNFREIVEYKEQNPDTELLVGNHDFSYWPGIEEICSGYQADKAFIIKEEFYRTEKLFKIAHKEDNFLFTHAGVTKTFMNNAFGKDGWEIKTVDESLNELWKHKPASFGFYRMGWSMYGDDIQQGPLWVRPKSLIKDSGVFRRTFTQIVGHTTQDKIDLKGFATGKKYYFTDTQDTSKEYLIITDGKVSVGKIFEDLCENHQYEPSVTNPNKGVCDVCGQEIYI